MTLQVLLSHKLLTIVALFFATFARLQMRILHRVPRSA
jgi:hypothetical protein